MIDMGISLVMPFYRLPNYYDWENNFPDFIWFSLLRRKENQRTDSIIFSPQSTPENNFSESISKFISEFSSPYGQQSPYYPNAFGATKTGFTSGFTDTAAPIKSRNYQGEQAENLLDFYTVVLPQTDITSGFAERTTLSKSVGFDLEAAENMLDFYSFAVLQAGITSGFTKNISTIKSGNFQTEKNEKLLAIYNNILAQTLLANGFTDDEKTIRQVIGEAAGVEATENLLKIYAPAASQNPITSDFIQAAESRLAEASALSQALAAASPQTNLYFEQTSQDSGTTPFLYTKLIENSLAATEKSSNISPSGRNIFTGENGQSKQEEQEEIRAKAAPYIPQQSRSAVDISAIIDSLSLALGEAAENSCEGVHI